MICLQGATYSRVIISSLCGCTPFQTKLIFMLSVMSINRYCRIWGADNPHVVVEKPLHPESDCLVWVVEWLVQNEDDNVIVNGMRRREIPTDFLWLLYDLDLEELYFQQNAATCYTSPATIDLLSTKFVIVVSAISETFLGHRVAAIWRR